MGDGGSGSGKSPVVRFFHGCLMLLGGAIALELAFVVLEGVLPWVIGVGSAVGLVWAVVAVIRWRRSRW